MCPSEHRILIVDDEMINIDILVKTLENDHEVQVALDGESALDIISEEKPGLILLDIMMPGINGYEVCRRLKADPGTAHIPIIFLTAMTEEEDEAKGLELGAVDYVTKPFSTALIKARVFNQLELKKHRDHLEEMVRERTRELMLTQDLTICSLANLAEKRDPETGGHILRTQRYIGLLAQKLSEHPDYRDQLDETAIELMYKSAPLHDIGKVGVEDRILLKPGKLTDREFQEMKKHTLHGRDTFQAYQEILGDNSFMKYAREIAYTHHERWDGTGYPEGLAGNAIPLSGRLMAIADVYDSLISKRVYKQSYSHHNAVECIRRGRGTHFDPDIVDVFLSIQEAFRKIALEFADCDEERQALQERDSDVASPR